MDILDVLFSDVNAIGSGEVARAFDMSESEARSWAGELGVARIGASFAWTRTDVESLVARLDDLDDADDEDEEVDEGPDDEEE